MNDEAFRSSEPPSEMEEFEHIVLVACKISIVRLITLATTRKPSRLRLRAAQHHASLRRGCLELIRVDEVL
jgi:hypothetical protein